MKHKNTFIHAANGILHAFRKERNFRIHVLATLLVIMLGVVITISRVEWLFVIGCCMLLLSLELLNTAIENLCDLVTEDYHPIVKIVKDTAAGAVLVAAAGSVITGLIIFLPKIIHLLK
jgi:diacylglycerol kinase